MTCCKPRSECSSSKTSMSSTAICSKTTYSAFNTIGFYCECDNKPYQNFYPLNSSDCMLSYGKNDKGQQTGGCCRNGANGNVIATDATVEVTLPFWTETLKKYRTTLPNFESSVKAEDSFLDHHALLQLAGSTAGLLADEEVDEKIIKGAVTIGCTVILRNIDELAVQYLSGKKVGIMTSKNIDIYENTKVTEVQDTRNSKYTFQTSSTFTERETFDFYYPNNLWVFRGGNYNLATNSTTKKLLGATSIVQSTLDATFLKEENVTNNFTIGYSNEIALEIGLMTGVASRTTTPSEEVKLGAENAYPKDTKDNFSNAISAVRADIGVTTIVFF